LRVGGGGIGPRQEFINIIAGACMTAIVLSIVGLVLGQFWWPGNAKGTASEPAAIISR